MNDASLISIIPSPAAELLETGTARNKSGSRLGIKPDGGEDRHDGAGKSG
ncbi:hypothetical protein [Prosthecobacter debontii]|nr:hypothetical protein [Prosthecobacter debontii]